jgi:hypothetical protein
MFEIKRTAPIIPGYTGHLSKLEHGGFMPDRKPARSEIPGYGGFINGVKAENQFGKTYGKLTFMSSANEFHRGSEIPHDLRYTSMLQNSFVNQRQVQARAVAEIVGVTPKQTFYSTSGFKGAGSTGKSVDFGTSGFSQTSSPSKDPLRLGTPLPGYTGVSRRVVADNVFGATYGDARRKAAVSLSNINTDKEKNLTTQLAMIPPVRR